MHIYVYLCIAHVPRTQIYKVSHTDNITKLVYIRRKNHTLSTIDMLPLYSIYTLTYIYGGKMEMVKLKYVKNKPLPLNRDIYGHWKSKRCNCFQFKRIISYYIDLFNPVTYICMHTNVSICSYSSHK